MPPRDNREYDEGLEPMTTAETWAFLDEHYPGWDQRGPVSRNPVERAEKADTVVVENLQDKARAWARHLLAEVSPEELVVFAAPPKHNKPSTLRQNPFDPRAPAINAERHGPYADCTDRGFSGRAVSRGMVPGFGTAIRSEIILVSLVSGEEPKYGRVCDGRGVPRSDEAPIAAAIFPFLWTEHEKALILAEEKKLIRSFEPSPLRTPRAELVHNLFGRLSDVKLLKNHIALRNMLKVLDRVIKECRQGISP